MAFIPSQALASVLAESQVGLWIESLQDGRVALVCKVPETTIKALYRGAGCTLLLSVVQVEALSVLCLGLRVQDEPEHPLVAIAPLLSSRDPEHPSKGLDSLKEILATRTATLHCLNGLNHPLLSASCALEASAAEAALDGLKAANPFVLTPSSYVLIPSSGDTPQPSDALRLAKQALRSFQKHIYGAGDDSVTMTASIALALKVWPPQEVFEVSATLQAGPFLVSDPEEGKKQEQSVQLAIDAIYPGSTYLSPTVKDGSSMRELTDVLAFDAHWICLLESKAPTILAGSMDRSSERRASIVMNHITKALNQLRGALTKLRSGSQVHDDAGRPITVTNQKTSPAHAIVLLSEMYAFLDWKQIARQIIEASDSDRHKALFHVVDLLELSYVVNRSQDADDFNNFMAQRWLAVKMKETAYLRTRVPTKPV